MVDQQASLDQTFAALADPTRREILARLRRGPVNVGDLAEPFDMTLAAVSKHLGVLERAVVPGARMMRLLPVLMGCFW